MPKAARGGQGSLGEFKGVLVSSELPSPRSTASVKDSEVNELNPRVQVPKWTVSTPRP